VELLLEGFTLVLLTEEADGRENNVVVQQCPSVVEKVDVVVDDFVRET